MDCRTEGSIRCPRYLDTNVCSIRAIHQSGRRQGCLSTAYWVAWRCSVSLRSAREHVRVARRLGELRAIHAEFAAGRLSYSKVRAISRVATRVSEADLVELARHASASQLDVLVRAYSRARTKQANDVHANRFVAWSWEDDGSLSVRANLPAEDGATVIAAIEAAAERLREERKSWSESESPADRDGSAEPQGGVVSRAEALVSIAGDSLERGSLRDRGAAKPADRNMVVVHVDADELAVDGNGRCHVREGSGLSAETARRIACDSSVVTLLERKGEPMSVGRRTRSVPPAMRRAVEARDQGCRFPGCHHKRYVDAHHIHHSAAGGETAADNLVMLCRRHHRLLHEGGYSVTGTPGSDRYSQLIFRRPDGTPLDSSPVPPRVPDPGHCRPPAPSQFGPLRLGSGERMDLGYRVDAMFRICEPARAARGAPSG